MKYLYFLITVLFLNAFMVQGQNTYVPDDGFEAILIDLGYDAGPLDDHVPTANIAGVTSLSIQSFIGFDPDVNDFTGIEDFASLTSFTANFVSAPSIDLSNNTDLTYVSVIGGYLTDVNLKNGNNTLLTNLNIFSFNGGGSTISPVRICIDDINYANANLQDIYATGNYFVENCTTNVNSITGTTYFDADNSGTCDPSEVVSSGGYLTSTGSGAGNYIFTSYPFLENYATYSLDPNVTISLGGIPPYFNVTAVPIAPATSETFVYTNTGNQDVVDYCITANSTVNDLQVETYAVTASKPGFQTRIRIKYKNTGTTTLSGAVSLNYDGLQEVFNNAFDTSDGNLNVPFPPATSPNTLSWTYTNMSPFETRSIDVFFTLNTPIDPVNPLLGGDMMTYNAAITPIAGDATPANNGHSFIDPIVNAYDPNDVTCFEGDKISLAQVPDDLTYRIRFQNTGNAAATNILVNNAIDSDLDISTFQFIGASDPVTITTTGPNEMKFTFLNINLPDSTSDEPNSHGWILYKMKPQSSATIGDVFENTASIYFDYNAPIITNTATTTVAAPTFVPDDNFENYLETHAEFGAVVPIGDPTAMGNGIANDNFVTTANISGVTFLDISALNIADATGIEDFAALDYFLCEGNQLTTLDLSQNTALTALFANANQLTSLNVQNGNNINVTSFMTSNNPNLNCIQVDDAVYSTANWTNIDAQSSFSTSCSAISGVVSYNCATPVPQQNVQVKATATVSGNIYYTTTNSLGAYAFNINETGSIVIETAAPNLTATPANHTVTYAGQAISGQDFCVDSTTIGDDVNVTLVPLTPAPRPGFASTYRIYYGNYGSTTQSGEVKFNYDEFKVGSVSSPDTFTQNGSELTWTYTNLAPFEIRHIDVVLNINPATGPNAVTAGEYLLNTVLITPIQGDIFNQDNFDEAFEEVVNGYDPNDVTIMEGPYIQPNQSGDFLNFRIRFQNTGNASAVNIEVQTTLDANLDWSTFTPLASSHTMNTSVTNLNDISFDFPAINLDYATNNEPASHGWVTFKIKPVVGFAIGDIVSSQASIFFDTNAPIITNTTTVQIAPPALPSQGVCGYSQIAAGSFHTLAIKSDGTLWAWGHSFYGQLGDGTTAPKNTPTQIGTDSNWGTLSAGTNHSIALKTDGTLWAWGWNSNGQLGDGTTSNKYTPTQIGTDTNWSSISTGREHTLALKTDGTLWAWGWNFLGTLGDGTTSNKNSPTQIGADSNWSSISTGLLHNVALKTDGTLWAWGRNTYGELGDGTNTYKNVPTQIGTDSNWSSVSAGGEHSIALKTDGTLWAWGHNAYGELGDGTNSNKNTPTQIGADSNWSSVSTGFYRSIALKTDSTLWSWGRNTFGQLGNGTTTDSNSPAQIGTDTNWSSVSAGTNHSIALKTDGTLWAMGWNAYGQLGNGTNINRNTPTPVFCAVPPLALTYVPDDNFETYLETHDASGNVVVVGDPTSMGNGIALDDYVTTANINMVTALNVINLSIVDMTGIEDFAALSSLDCSANQIVSLDLSANLNLVQVYCFSNQIASLVFGNNPNLLTIECYANALSSFDITQLQNLNYIDCGFNPLTSLNTSQNGQLTTLFCGSTTLTQIDASLNTMLSSFVVSNNPQLTSLNVANGNNINFTNYSSIITPSLLCIEVDDTAYSSANWFNIDPVSSFSTDCSLLDTDLDGITDSDEVNIHYTHPNDADTDNDGLSDGDEINIYSTNPLTADSDGDGLFDGTEVGVTAPLADTDVSAGNFIADADAGVTTTDPNNDDTDGDNLLDGQEDANHNGSTDNPVIGGTGTVGSGETDPNMADSDLDGISDGDEVLLHGSNPLDTDSDDGGADDGTEINIDGTDPLQPADDDADGDGFSIATGDCDDTNAAINPAATEVCDGIDNNCDGTIDESGDLFYVDADGDGFGDDNLPQVSGCGLTIGYSSINGDCDDTDPLVNPAATEICDGIDNNCDGTIDESGDLFYVDADGDGFGDDNVPLVPGCGLAGNGYSTVGGDCDDSNATVYPGAPEVFDGVDNNCNGQVDEALTYVPDDNFEQRLITLGYDTGALDDYVPTANINTVISLDVASQGIADLTGIEDFAALQNLTATSNNLTTVNITQNTQLLTVNFLFNSLTALDVSQNLNLVTLITHHNNLTSLDISNNLQLTGLDCRVNNISALDISNPLLAWVHTSDNGMTSLTTGANTALSSLYCHNNALTNLDFSANTSLNLLYADNNQLTSLNVKNGNNLNVVEFRAQTNPNLLCIEVDDASYSSVNWFNIDPVSSFGTDCSDADGDGYFAFEDCDDNDPLVNPGAVEVFDGIDNNCNGEIDEDLTYVPDDNFETYLETHDASGAVVALGDPTSMGNGIALDDYVTTSHINTVTSLNVNSLNIADLTGIADFSALINLTCQYNQLTTIGVSTLTSLTTLYCNNNLIVSLDVSPNAALTEFACHSNLLADLNVQNGNNINFTHFSAINNPDLTCIFVDDATYSTANWINIDSTATFVNDQAGCDALGVNDFTLPALTLYPNPASSTVQIEGLITTATYTLYNAIGVQVSRGEVVNNEQIDINSLASGLYFLKLDSGNILKFVKE